MEHLTEVPAGWCQKYHISAGEHGRGENITTLLTNRHVEVINMMIQLLCRIQQMVAANPLSMRLKWMQLVSTLCLLVQTL